ncbi:hypothetical protein J32TS6_04840 [Virgibacillus pantothenticus]|uniref:hypothetical protein n=1 Tax=Virgibacillus pantothenticus TaxID=1473 RepID=UPI001B1057F4|nr:hypothetical protein [Virgibacillus pantothenticus]GIP61929.1 hypothetical protein J32TS6_04840 [Virgibacillus pantothenticus]
MEPKRRTGKYKEIDDYNKLGRDIKEIFRNYKKYITKTESRLFLGIPVIISIIIFCYLGFFEESNTTLLSHIVEMNQVALTVIAILAGFNTTSLSIIAASNNKKLSISNDGVLRQLTTFFSFAIVVQLLVLIAGILFSIISKTLDDVSLFFTFLSGLTVKLPLLLFGAFWLTLILFTIIISIRNATLLYRYVIFVADD